MEHPAPQKNEQPTGEPSSDQGRPSLDDLEGLLRRVPSEEMVEFLQALLARLRGERSPAPSGWVTSKEAASHIGISVSTFYKLWRRLHALYGLETVKIGGKRVYYLPSLDGALLAASRREDNPMKEELPDLPELPEDDLVPTPGGTVMSHALDRAEGEVDRSRGGSGSGASVSSPNVAGVDFSRPETEDEAEDLNDLNLPSEPEGDDGGRPAEQADSEGRAAGEDDDEILADSEWDRL